MERFVQSDLIETRRDPSKGRGARGVYALRPIAPDTVIERTPVILIPKAQVFGDSIHARNAARISWYVFAWKVKTHRDYVALALGYGSLYNHSFEPNALYRCSAPDVMEYVCIRAIEPGEEITINYNGDPNDRTPMEFPLAQGQVRFA